ncbi:MAG: hypothetical protein LBK70_02220 [Clostridiales bacterium]|nr:hypothetical protein [Clostridiales bacterium]
MTGRGVYAQSSVIALIDLYIIYVNHVPTLRSPSLVAVDSEQQDTEIQLTVATNSKYNNKEILINDLSRM